MNQAQALRALQNVVRLTRLADRTAAAARPVLEQVYRQVAAQVRDLTPEGDTLFRQARWRMIEGQLRVLLEPANDALRRELIGSLAAEIPAQIKAAEEEMLAGGMQPYQRADELSPGAGEVVQASGVAQAIRATSEGPLPMGAVLGAAQITPTQLVRVAQGTQVLGRSLGDLFAVLDEEGRHPLSRPPVYGSEYAPPYIRRNIKIIDQTVKRGFLLGETNDEIARNLETAGVGRAQREAETIARTAVMQMSEDAHQAFFDANSSVIGGWEYDASMDYMVCAICAPWDGRTAKDRKELPKTPQHPRCRCKVNPLSPTELAVRQKEGPQARVVIELVPARKGAPPPASRPGYKVTQRPIRVDGKRYWRVAKTLQPINGRSPSMADWLSQANAATQAQVLGSQARAEAFRQAAAQGDPQSALVRVTMRPRSRPSVEKRAREPRGGMKGSRPPHAPPAVRPLAKVPRRRNP